MKNCFRLFSISIFLYSALPFSLFSQGIGIGEWRDHLPYNNCVAVAQGDGFVYCATRYAVFSFNKSDNSIQRITKVNYLSDIGVSRIVYMKSLKTLIITYSNGNIDLFENNTAVTNISDIKRKPVPGNKAINNILVTGNYAYLSCGFGIVVLDVAKKEIKDTYCIGDNGTQIEIMDMASGGGKFFAATENGVYEADMNNPNLSNYISWTKHTEMPNPNAKYNEIAFFNNKVYANYYSGVYNKDTLYVLNNNTWYKYNPAYHRNIYSLQSDSNKMLLVNEDYIEIIDTSETILSVIYTYNPGQVIPRDAIFDEDNFNILWIADVNFGLVKNSYEWSSDSYLPDGPMSVNVIDMAVEENNLWVVPGGVTSNWDNMYNNDGVFSYINDEWETFPSIFMGDTAYDLVCVAVNPANPANVYAGSWSRGLIEINNQVVSALWDDSNSTLRNNEISGYVRLRIGGVCFDKDGNLWVTNSDTKYNTALHVKTPDNSWKSYNFTGYLNNTIPVGDIVIDKNNQKWIILPRGHGLLVFDGNNTISNTADDKIIKLSNAAGNGALPSNAVYSMAVDNAGEIWVGTDKGIAVFYSPENVFSGSNFDAQQILVDQDGYIQPLLESETVTAIAVDGSDKKWIGTQRAGVFLISDDGTTQLAHFTEDNSPLFSNTINTIAINQKNGEVFFGTDKGIISYRGYATGGSDEYSEVLVYPNPVRESYNGYIAIKGLVTNADVKITDITGTLVYQTIAEGGQAVWNGKNYSGEKVKTGVYPVFVSNSDGSKTKVTKIMIIN